MKTIKLILILTTALIIISCSNESKKNYSELEQRYNLLSEENESLKSRLNVMADSILVLKFSASDRLYQIEKLFSDNDFEKAKKQIVELKKVFPFSKEIQETDKLEVAIAKKEEEQRKEEERIKALGYKVFKDNTSGKIGNVSFVLSGFTFGTQYTFGNCSDVGEYSYRTADKDNRYFLASLLLSTKENCNDIGDTLKFIHSIGVKRVMINRVNIGGEAIKNTEDLLMTRDELNKAFETAALISKELKLSVTSNVCTPICILNPKNFKGIRFTSCSFDMKNRPITLDYKGNIRFCNHSPIELGNIFQHSLENIFNSRKVQEWKNAVPDFCMDCKAYDSCKAGCRAAAEQMGLSLNHPDPIINYMDLDHALLMKLKSNHSTSFGMQSQE